MTEPTETAHGERVEQQAEPTDTQRLDWMLHIISGVEFRRIGITYSAGCTRADIDAAIAQRSGETP